MLRAIGLGLAQPVRSGNLLPPAETLADFGHGATAGRHENRLDALGWEASSPACPLSAALANSGPC
jgi:hypothetical protein